MVFPPPTGWSSFGRPPLKHHVDSSIKPSPFPIPLSIITHCYLLKQCFLHIFDHACFKPTFLNLVVISTSLTSPTQVALGPKPVWLVLFSWARAFSFEYFNFNFFAKSKSCFGSSEVSLWTQSTSNRPRCSFPSKQAQPRLNSVSIHVSPAYESEFKSLWKTSYNKRHTFQVEWQCTYILTCVYY